MTDETIDNKAPRKDSLTAQIRERLGLHENSIRGLIDRLASQNRLSEIDAQALQDDLSEHLGDDGSALSARLDDLIKERIAALDLPKRSETRELRARLVLLIERAEALEAKLLANGQS